MPRDQARRRSTPDPTTDRRKQILRAAVQVFAERGFHRTRVSDIARRAGVAYGLIYHYFESKDDVLNSLFAENWAVFVKVLEDLAAAESRSAEERLGEVSDLLIDTLRIHPHLIQVIIQEVSRSDRFVQPAKFEAFQRAFEVVQRIIEQGQARGELRGGFDTRAASFLFFGALETICTGFTLHAIPCATDAEADALKDSVKQVLLRGMVAAPGAAESNS